MLPSLPLNFYHVSVYFLLSLGGENIQDPVSYFFRKKTFPVPSTAAGPSEVLKEVG